MNNQTWNLANNIYELKEKNKATFCSPSEEWVHCRNQRWVRMFDHINTLPALLMNYQRIREQKCNRGSSKHSVHTHFSKDPNCDICLKTKITRSSCERRAGTGVPRAEHFGDLITANHKVLSEESQTRNNHRYAVMVQDLATQWLQSYPCETKTSWETQKSPMKFLEPTRKPKVIYSDTSL